MVAVEALKQRLSSLDDAAIEALFGKSLFVTAEWSRGELETLCQVAEAFEALDRRHIRTPLLQQELAYALFFDNSTRTKSAWAGAASRLGMHPVIVDGSSTQVAHGETAEETGCMLGMNAHALGVRHDLILGQGTPFMRDMERGSRSTSGRPTTRAACRWSTCSATSTTRPRRWPTCSGCGSISAAS